MNKQISDLFTDFLQSKNFARYKKKVAKSGEKLTKSEKEINKIYLLLERGADRFAKGCLSDSGAISAIWWTWTNSNSTFTQ